MKGIALLKLLLSVVIAFLSFQIAPVLAVDLNSFGGRVFLLQKKMALRGNALAQYKLGTFYEFGVSVSPDLTAAKSWYQKATVKKYRPAMNRLMYLDILQSNFNEAKHGAWLKNILEEAQVGRADALIIAGQLYHRGIGVKKNLKQALKMLKRAASAGHIEVSREIDEITRKISPPKKKVAKKTNIQKKKPVVVAEVKKVKISKEKASSEPPTSGEGEKSTPKSQKNKKESKELRRMRYEAAMRKYYQQQLILQQQQEWSENAENEE